MASSGSGKAIQRLRRSMLGHDGARMSDGQLLGCFIDSRDDTAFAALVKRHGPMVWGVCRRLLDHHDAEDAFQAAFLVLARKAASIRPREMLANWLYGTAHRTALQARRTTGRRRTHERQVPDMPEAAAKDQKLWDDMQPLLDEELARLPDKYRAVLILCELEGKTRKQVAEQLGCPEGTVAGWLARARTMLARRLTRRGLQVSAALLATALSGQAASAAPPSLVSATINAGGLLAAGRAASAGISMKVLALTQGVLKTMLLKKLRIAGVLVLLAVVATGAALMYPTQASVPPKSVKKERTMMTDKEKLQGDWKLISAEEHGSPVPADKIQNLDVHLNINDEQMTFTSRQRHGMLTIFKLDPTKRPRTVAMTVQERNGTASLLHGIYEVDGDRLKLCWGEEAPTEFKTKADRQADQRFYVFQHEKVDRVQRSGK